MNKRIEKDLMGEKEISDEVYWGIHTARAMDNFSGVGRPVHKDLIKAIVLVKKAACETNQDLGYLDQKKADVILKACDEILDDRFNDQFPVEALQGGAGTSTNMNVNEVIANRSIELLGGVKGNYLLMHPIEDVNKHQSTNDVYPTGLKIAIIYKLKKLADVIAGLQGSFQNKEKEFAHIIKVGRTEMQEAVPMTLGKEFSAFAEAFSRDRWRIFKCEERIRTVNIGGSAIGTGLTAPREYIFLVIEKLRNLTGLGLCRSENVVDSTSNMDAFVEIFGILNAHAVNLIKVSNDLRLLALLGEIQLSMVQIGSSIMPGKINPVLLEAVIQSGIKVTGNQIIISQACSQGTLQINEFLPLIADTMLESLDVLIHANLMLKKCIDHVNADEARCRFYLDQSPSIITAFLPLIGYQKCQGLLSEKAMFMGSMREFLNHRLGKETVDQVLSDQNLTALGYRKE